MSSEWPKIVKDSIYKHQLLALEHQPSFKLLIAAFLKVNPTIKHFVPLQQFLEQDSTRLQTVVSIAKHALQLTEILPQCPPLMPAQQSGSVILTVKQVRSLIAHCFLGTINHVGARNDKTWSEFSMLQCMVDNRDGKSHEKLKCLFAYFEAAADVQDDHLITYTRLVQQPQEQVKWQSCNANLGSVTLEIEPIQGIESAPADYTRVDFAHKFVGGPPGHVFNGCLQEEITLLTHSEFMVSMLLCERMADNEAVLVEGVETYSRHSGYARQFEFRSATPVQRPRVSIVAIDALVFSGGLSEQLKDDNLLRELNKAACGFTGCRKLSTGNWGCGAFGGNVQLKFLIQLMAMAAQYGEVMRYHSFGSHQLRDMVRVTNHLKDVSVAQLYKFLSRQVDVSQDLFKQVLEHKLHQSTEIYQKQVISHLSTAFCSSSQRHWQQRRQADKFVDTT